MSDTRASPLGLAPKKLTLEDPVDLDDLAVEEDPVKTSIVDLDDLAVEEITKYIDLPDLVKFSNLNAQFVRILGQKSVIWSKQLKKLNFLSSPRLDSLATSLSALFPVGCDEKRRLMVYKKTLNNWKTGNAWHASMHLADFFGARNDVLLFVRQEQLGGGDILPNNKIWHFTAFGPKANLNWMLYGQPSAFLLPASGPDFFIFENTICLTIVEDPQSPW